MDKGGALLGGGSGARFLFFWLYDIVLAGLAAMLTAYFSPGVEGSGIPVSWVRFSVSWVPNFGESGSGIPDSWVHFPSDLRMDAWVYGWCLLVFD